MTTASAQAEAQLDAMRRGALVWALRCARVLCVLRAVVHFDSHKQSSLHWTTT